jgi:hypothetical protein
VYYDSSDDEDNVMTNPYEGVKTATPKEMQSQLTLKKLKNLSKPNTLFASELTYSHQHLLRNPAIAGELKEDNERRSPSPFPAHFKALRQY